ncbi:hypothetical protein GF420_14535 [candidate division GN15 bacterium]|nr:hypothetical protein [candidate division GN15 bacterium]
MRLFRTILILAIALGTFSSAGLADEINELYYAIEQNGTVCGYAHVLITETERDNRRVIELTDSLWIQIALMGKTITGKYVFTYTIDPVTGMYAHHTSEIDQETLQMGAVVDVDGNAVRIASLPDNDTSIVEVPPGTIFQNTRLHPHVVRWFEDESLESKTKTVFSEIDGVTNEVEYRKIGHEELQLIGNTYDALKVMILNRTTGVSATLWLAPETGLLLKTESIRSSYLADASIRERVQTAEFDSNIYAKVGTVISNPWALSYVKVHVKATPGGMWLTPEALNTPGQTFDGTVTDNRIDGVFEIRYDRYDGSDAPPFPLDFTDVDSLKPFLEPSDFIESDEPELIAEAKRITDGAGDAWEAATRLSEWVNEEIGYDLPGGGTALGTYRLRLGECGSHANLLAGFCRAVGIPARCVFGCMYVPDHGGAFGQHAWNEIYMGDAGWIPVDCTVDEVTYADCGHVRLGVWTSRMAMLNPDTIVLLDYSVGEGTFADLVKATNMEYAGLVGEYRGPDKVLTILTQDQRLAIDIPGQMTFQLKDPDEHGEWFFVLTDRVSVSFDTDASGRASSLTINSRQRLPRAQDTIAIDMSGIPEAFHAYVGKYSLPMQNALVSVTCDDNHLNLAFSQEHSVRMEPSDEGESFIARTPKSTLVITFDPGDAGTASALKFSELVTCPKIAAKESAH